MQSQHFLNVSIWSLQPRPQNYVAVFAAMCTLPLQMNDGPHFLRINNKEFHESCFCTQYRCIVPDRLV